MTLPGSLWPASLKYNSTEAETMRKCLAFVRVNGKNRLPKVVLRSLHICFVTCVPILTHITHRDYSGGRSQVSLDYLYIVLTFHYSAS